MLVIIIIISESGRFSTPHRTRSCGIYWALKDSPIFCFTIPSFDEVDTKSGDIQDLKTARRLLVAYKRPSLNFSKIQCSPLTQKLQTKPLRVVSFRSSCGRFWSVYTLKHALDLESLKRWGVLKDLGDIYCHSNEFLFVVVMYFFTLKSLFHSHKLNWSFLLTLIIVSILFHIPVFHWNLLSQNN